MKRIYISAYFNVNVGDDLFVYMLIQRYNHVKFHICCDPNRVTTFRNQKNVSVISKAKWILLKAINKFIRKKTPVVDESVLKKVDAVVKIGGSIFIEYDGWEKNWLNTEKPLFIVGANYGPASTQTFFNLVKEKIRVAEHCCFRDKRSFEMFSDLDNVDFAPDVLFGLDVYGIIKKNNHCKGIAISVIELEHRKELCEFRNDYISSVVSLVDHCLTNSIPVTLLGFCQNEGDENAIEAILAKCSNSNKVEKHVYNGDYVAFLKVMDACETIVATRFHAMILGWIMEKNVIPIIYSNKQRNVISDIGFDGYFFEVSDIKHRIDILIEACQNKMRPLNNIDELKEMASKQFEALDVYLDYCRKQGLY